MNKKEFDMAFRITTSKRDLLKFPADHRAKFKAAPAEGRRQEENQPYYIDFATIEEVQAMVARMHLGQLRGNLLKAFGFVIGEMSSI